MNFTDRLRRQLAQALQEALDQRRWGQRLAAQRLRTTQPRISDLKRGKHDRFSLDQLIQWLGELGHGVTVELGPITPVEPAPGADENDPDRILAEGESLLSEGDAERALEAFHRYFTLRPRCPLGLLNTARAHLANGQVFGAMTYCQEVTMRFPDFKPGRELLVEVRAKLEEYLANLNKPQAPSPA